MKRLLTLFLLACLCLAGCTAEGDYVPTGGGLSDGTTATQGPITEQPQSLTFTYHADKGFHPYKTTDPTNRALFSLIYQGLFAVDENYAVTPILCKEYEMSADMRSYTFYLDKATFSDGRFITAQDVVASLRSARSQGYYAGRFTHIRTIDATSDKGVTITLDTPCDNLPMLLDIPIIPANQLESPTPLGSGPYMLEDTDSGKRLRRQTAWWCNLPILGNVQIIPLEKGESPSQIRDLFEFSQLSMVCTDPGSDAYVDFRGDYELWESENGLFLYLACNKESKIFSNSDIRRALTHAIDRDFLVKEFFRGFAHSATLPASPSFPHYKETLAERYGYDAKVFADAVQKAQLEENEENVVIFLVNQDDSRRLRVARKIAGMLEAGGLQVTLTALPGKEFREALAEGEYDLYMGQTKLSPNMDLTEFFAEDGSLSYGGMTDVAAYALCLEALANSGNYESLHKQVMEEGWLCPILFRSYAVYGRRGQLSGLTPARDNLFYYSLGKTMLEAQRSEE